MEKVTTRIPGVHVVVLPTHSDARGSFVKVFSEDDYSRMGLQIQPREVFYSVSRQGVIRGFHFQLPPFAVAKVVWVVLGEIIDVSLDLRVDSPTYGELFATQLSAADGKAVYIPEGIGHAFCALSPSSVVAYCASQPYAPAHYAGVRWDSAGFSWPIADPIVSDQDANLPSFAQFRSPFTSAQVQ